MYQQSSRSSRQQEGHAVSYHGSSHGSHSPKKSSRSSQGHHTHTNPSMRSTSSSPGMAASPGRSRRRTHTSRSDSPAHSVHSTHSMPTESTHIPQQVYVTTDGRLTPPYHTPGHSRSSSMTSVKSGMMRDRSLDRADVYLIGHERGARIRDRSLDRQLDRHYERAYATGRDRTLDRFEREYPLMGARSLDRHFQSPSLVRSRSIDHEFLANQGMHGVYLTQSPAELRRDNLILDMQAQIADLNKECATVQQELDLTREKLSSSMNSIKTFWSPELKKERVMRKEEMGKYAMMNEQLRAAQAENQVSPFTLKLLLICHQQFLLVFVADFLVP